MSPSRRSPLGSAVLAGCLVVGLFVRPILADCPMHQQAHVGERAAPCGADHGRHQHSRLPQGCDCLGQCATSMPLDPGSAASHGFLTSELTAPALLPARDVLPLPPRHIIPFANGPPTFSLI
jgi:hypothetical protein